MSQLRRYEILVTWWRLPGGLKVVKTDPEDDKFLETAIAGGAKIIVSGDRHLLELLQYQDIQILTASDFLTRILK